MTNPINTYAVPSVSITTTRTGASANANELGMRAMQERAYGKRGERYLLIKSPPASGKTRALTFTALDKLHNQGMQQAIVVVPERSIGGSFADEALTQHGSIGIGQSRRSGAGATRQKTAFAAAQRLSEPALPAPAAQRLRSVAASLRTHVLDTLRSLDLYARSAAVR
jgi:hypothetical protein